MSPTLLPLSSSVPLEKDEHKDDDVEQEQGTADEDGDAEGGRVGGEAVAVRPTLMGVLGRGRSHDHYWRWRFVSRVVGRWRFRVGRF